MPISDKEAYFNRRKCKKKGCQSNVRFSIKNVISELKGKFGKFLKKFDKRKENGND